MFKTLGLASRLYLLLALLLAGTLVAGGYGFFALSEAQRAADVNLRTSEQLLTAVAASRAAQVSFKSQIQEYKNLLLRGHDQDQYDWYLSAFQKGTTGVVVTLIRWPER